MTVFWYSTERLSIKAEIGIFGGGVSVWGNRSHWLERVQCFNNRGTVIKTFLGISESCSLINICH